METDQIPGSCGNVLKGKAHPKINDYLLALMLMESHVSESTKHFWSFTAKERYSILLNN